MVKFMKFYRKYIHNKFGQFNISKLKNKFEYFVRSKYDNDIINNSNEKVIFKSFFNLLNTKRKTNRKTYKNNYYIEKKQYIRKPLRSQIISRNEIINVKKLHEFCFSSAV